MNENETMLFQYALIFLFIAIIVALFGFNGSQGVAENIAKVLFVVFLILFIIALFF